MNRIVIILIILAVLIALVWGAYFVLVMMKGSTGEQPGQQGQNQKTYDVNGMKVEILQEGSGVQANNGDTVRVHYVGTLLNGTKFDSSIDRNTPFTFTLGRGRVIKGWDLGVVGMKVGEKRKLTIPSQLAYGSNSIGVIPANATLIFEVELLKVN